MNDHTLVAVCGYAGDAHQIRNLMPYYIHHRCPVCIMSPEDAPITGAQISPRRELGFFSAGHRAYIGQESLDRQILHLRHLLRHPAEYKYFLVHDSDSVILDSRIPSYLYQSPEVVWSNIVSDAMHDHQRPPGYPWPHLAFQPPYFLSRSSVQKLVNVAAGVPADPATPFLDWAMMAWTVAAGLSYQSFPDGASLPTSPGSSSFDRMYELVDRHGKYVLHSIKAPESLKSLAWARLKFKQRFKKTP